MNIIFFLGGLCWGACMIACVKSGIEWAKGNGTKAFVLLAWSMLLLIAGALMLPWETVWPRS